MAKLYVTEFGGMAPGHIPVGIAPPLNDQTPVAIGGGSLQSSAFDFATVIVRIHSDAICSIAFGTNPTATANSLRLAANQTEYFAVKSGHKVAVISNT